MVNTTETGCVLCEVLANEEEKSYTYWTVHHLDI